MNKVNKIINYISWMVIVILGVLLLFNWNSIPSNIVVHSGMGNIVYGDKITLIMLFILVCSINALFTLGYDIPIIKSIRKSIKLSFNIAGVISIIVQIMVVLLLGIYILLPLFLL